MKLGATIRSFRRQRKIKQKGLAPRCGISTLYLSQMEKDRKVPTLTTLKAIARELDIPFPIIIFLTLIEDDMPGKEDVYHHLIKPVKAMVREIFM